MKKLFLLSALVCAGYMYGMEPLYPKQNILAGTWENLPTDVKSLIITAITKSGDDLDEAVKNIVKFSRVNNELNKMINLNDIQGFTKIVHILADKFNSTSYVIAEKFDTPMAKKYKELLIKLSNVVSAYSFTDDSASDDIISLVNQGADVNATFPLGSIITKAMTGFNIGRIETLLNLGAKPTNKDLNKVKDFIPFGADQEERQGKIIQLLEKAMEEQQ